MLLHRITNKTKLRDMLDAAVESIDVCMYVMSCAVLVDALISGGLH